MSDYELRVKELLNESARFIAESPWAGEYLAQVEALRTKFNEPCPLTVAVAGRVKAGKSSLVNALLKCDLAKVGVKATTATVNSFCYGKPDSDEKPILCIYRPGSETYNRVGPSEWVDEAFLNRMQTDDETLLKQSVDIQEMRYYLLNESLRDMILIDTPGTDSLHVIHTEHTSALLNRQEQLLAKRAEINGSDTLHRAAQADAVLFVSGEVALESMKEFLDDFSGTAGDAVRAFNAIGVVAQIDKSDEIIADRNRLAGEMAKNLNDRLNTAIPVSAGIAHALQTKSDRLKELQSELKKLSLGDLKFMLKGEECWLDENDPDCPIDIKRRKELLAGFPWRVFAVMARRLYDEPWDAARANLWNLSGFDQLGRLLKEHFLNRKRMLFCFNTLNTLYGYFRSIQSEGLMKYEDAQRQDRKRMKRFGEFIASHPQRNSPVGNELRRFLSDCIRQEDPGQEEARRNQISDLLLQMDIQRGELEHLNVQFNGLIKLESLSSSVLSAPLRDELRILFDNSQRKPDGYSVEFVGQRQRFWRRESARGDSDNYRNVAAIAEECYSWELEKLL